MSSNHTFYEGEIRDLHKREPGWKAVDLALEKNVRCLPVKD
jgi:hypothetical protein